MSNEIIRLGVANSNALEQTGKLIGGLIPSGGGSLVLSPGDGPTTVTIVFRTKILDHYTDVFPSGNAKINPRDTVTDTVIASGDLLDNLSLAPVGQTRTDNSSATVTIVPTTFSKTIYAINGSTAGAPFSTPRIAAGDTVTYRLQYTNPIGSTENLTLEDFLPLPIFDATTVTAFSSTTPSASSPPAGKVSFGPNDTFFAQYGPVNANTPPAISYPANANSVKFKYNTFDYPPNTTLVVDILFTVTVSNSPFADKLFLTNQAQVTENNTNPLSSSQTQIVMIELTEPVLNIKKGVVSHNNTNPVQMPVYSSAPLPPAPVTFTVPTATPTPNPRFSGVINSAQLTGSFLGTGTISSTGTAVTGTGTSFLSQVAVGELIVVGGQTVAVSAVNSDTSLTTGTAFSPAIAGGSNYFVKLTSGIPIDSDLYNVDAGDLVTFAITLENTGLGLHGAFNVQVVDSLPTGFHIPSPAGLNISVTNGAGKVLPFFNIGGGTGLLDQGIQLSDSGVLIGNGTISSSGKTVTGSGTAFTTQVHVGDVIAVGTQSQVVTAIANDTSLTTTNAFSPVIAAGSSYSIYTGTFAGSGTISTSGTTVTGVGTSFMSQIHVGDLIIAGSESETVTAVNSDTSLTTAVAFNPAVTAGTAYSVRVQGTISGYDPVSGTNIVIITYDLQADRTTDTNPVQANQVIVNTATLLNYDSAPTGGTFLTSPKTDTATVVIAKPAITKVLTSTSINNTSNDNTHAVIGELATYTVTVTVPEGVMPTALVVDTLPAGMAFVDIVSITPSNGNVTSSKTPSNATAGTAAGKNPLVSNASGGTANVVTFDFGTISNANTGNSGTDTLAIAYRAVVLDVAGNVKGTTLTNSALLTWAGNASTVAAVSAPAITVLEPKLKITKTATVNTFAAPPAMGDASDPMVYTIVIQHDSTTSNADALDVTFTDTVPSEITIGSIGVVDSASIVTAASFQISGQVVSTKPGVSFDLPLDSPIGSRTITITINGQINTTAITGESITNTAKVNWTSISGNPGTITPFNAASTERTGAGGVDNYTASSSNTFSIFAPQPVKNIIATSQTTNASLPSAANVNHVTPRECDHW